MALAPADWRPVCVCGAWCVRSRNIVSVPNGLAGRTHWRMGLQRNSRVAWLKNSNNNNKYCDCKNQIVRYTNEPNKKKTHINWHQLIGTNINTHFQYICVRLDSFVIIVTEFRWINLFVCFRLWIRSILGLHVNRLWDGVGNHIDMAFCEGANFRPYFSCVFFFCSLCNSQ